MVQLSVCGMLFVVIANDVGVVVGGAVNHNGPIVQSTAFGICPSFLSSSSTTTRTTRFSQRPINLRVMRKEERGREWFQWMSKDSIIEEDPHKMKIRDIKSELQELGIGYADCFDRESLLQRLAEARSGTISSSEAAATTSTRTNEIMDVEEECLSSQEPSTERSANSSFDREATIIELKTLRVSELRSQLASRNIRWGGMIDKDDLVRALVDHMELTSQFSSSGKIMPGSVADLNDDDLTMELEQPTTTTPLLLDVYATWCGPCQMMAPQLKEVAKELGHSVRVAKIDSDQNPKWASKLQVAGLPTILLFDGRTGKELDRLEGALMKQGILDFVNNALTSSSSAA